MTVPSRVIGRYALYGEIAAGGMATVHYGRLLGPVGFSRTVAIKRLHPQFAKNPEFVSMFLDEARIAARIRHPNVVATLDVVATEGELFLVMDYVQGESLSRLAKAVRNRKERIPPRILAAIMAGALHGLHAAHEAKNERGEPLDIVHRDISPQNVLVGTDGTARVLDFGVAKASGRIQNTKEGHLKGKIAYMAPEQIRGNVSRRTDVYAASIVAWELLTGQRLFACDDEVATIAKVLEAKVDPPSQASPGVPKEFDDVIMKGLAFDENDRYATAREMALALEKCVGVASASEVGDWVESHAAEILSMRAGKISEIESSSSNLGPVDGSGLVAQLKDAPTEPEAGPPVSAPTPATPQPPPSMKVLEPASKADGPVTSPSSISVTSAAASRPAARRGGTIALVVAGFVVVAIAAFALGGRSQKPAPASAVAPSAPVSAAARPEPAPVPVPEPAPVPEPVPAPAPVAPAEERAAAPTAPPARAPRSPNGPPKHAAPKPNCSPPFTLDAAGRKKYKPECL